MAVTWTAGQPGAPGTSPRPRAAGRDAQRARALRDHSRPHIRLVVDRVVLEGVAPADRHWAGEALAAGLSELVAAWGAPAGLSDRTLPPSLPAAMDLATGESAAGVGAKLAAAVYRALESAGGVAREGNRGERR
jgi:hypothetical protein